MSDHVFFQNKVTVSIVTVVYNAASVLEQTIESVKAQTYSDIEYIIVDGGSTDGTLDVIKRNRDIVDHWVSEQDSGIYDAMNKGVALAHGDYVIFMNAGDTFYCDDSLKKLAIKIGDSRPDVIMTSYIVHSAMRNNGIRRCRRIKDLWKGMITSHQAILFKRDAGVYHDMKAGLAADYNLVVRKFVGGCSFALFPEIILSVYAGGGVSDIKRNQIYKSWYNSAKMISNRPVWFHLYYAMKFTRELLRLLAINLMARIR